MDRQFSDDDRQKRVVTADGQRIGRVRDVDEDRATVEHSDDDDRLTGEIKEMLGWSDDDDDTHELRRDQVDRYDDDEIHLSGRR